MSPYELGCAGVKLERALGARGPGEDAWGSVDPTSGYTTLEVVEYVRDGIRDIDTPVEVASSARALLRRLVPDDAVPE